MAKIKSIKQFKERVDGAYETMKTRDEGMRLMRRVPCAVFVNLRKVTGDELRIVCSAVQYCVLYRPNCARLRKWALVLMSDPLDNHKIAFGVVHFALRRFPRWCARRWGRYCLPMHGRVGGTLSHPRSASARASCRSEPLRESAQALSLAPIGSNVWLSGLALHKENAISKRSAKRIGKH